MRGELDSKYCLKNYTKWEKYRLHGPLKKIITPGSWWCSSGKAVGIRGRRLWGLGNLTFPGAEHFARTEESLRCAQGFSRQTKKTAVNSKAGRTWKPPSRQRNSKSPSFQHRRESSGVFAGKAWPFWNHIRNFLSSVKGVDIPKAVKPANSKEK